MMTEYASYPATRTVRQVLDELTRDTSSYEFLTVHYIYVTGQGMTLRGVARIRDLASFFDDHDLAAVPVVDDRQRLLGSVAWAWKGNAVLGAVVGAALALNTVIAVSIGGTVPLILRRLNLDPAVATGPLLTTATDMCGFFLLLSLASVVLPALV